MIEYGKKLNGVNMMNKSNISMIIGTRAETIKMIPIIEEFKKREIKIKVIGTGQHNLDNYYKPDFYLTTPPDKSSRFGFSKLKALMWGFKIIIKIFKNVNRKDLILIHGDTLSSALISIGASLRKCKIVHIEAGLRSNNMREPFPEEIMRKIVDNRANILFLPTKLEIDNVKNYNEKESYVVGNTIIDNLKKYNLQINIGNYVVVSIHRQENMRNQLRMRMIVNALNHICLPIYIYAHDPFIEALNKFELKLNDNIKIMKMVSHKEFMQKVSGSYFVIADGGSIQEECAWMKKPCILFRQYTERHGFDFGNGEASKKIVEELLK